MLELLGALVPQEDGEHLVVDDALEEDADALEEIVEVEDAGDLAGDLVEDGEGLGLAGDAGVEAGVFDGDGHARGDEFEQALMVGGEEAGDLGLDIDDSDDFAFDDERDGELGADVGVGVDVVLDVLRGTYVGMRMDPRWRAAWPTMPRPSLDAHALDLGGVAGLEAHPELVGAVVEEEDGEDAVVDDGADEVGDAVHQGVEVEGGVEGVGEASEEIRPEGARRGCWRTRGGFLAAGPVVAFEVCASGDRHGGWWVFGVCVGRPLTWVSR